MFENFPAKTLCSLFVKVSIHNFFQVNDSVICLCILLLQFSYRFVRFVVIWFEGKFVKLFNDFALLIVVDWCKDGN